MWVGSSEGRVLSGGGCWLPASPRVVVWWSGLDRIGPGRMCASRAVGCGCGRQGCGVPCAASPLPPRVVNWASPHSLTRVAGGSRACPCPGLLPLAILPCVRASVAPPFASRGSDWPFVHSARRVLCVVVVMMVAPPPPTLPARPRTLTHTVGGDGAAPSLPPCPPPTHTHSARTAS